MYEALRSLNGSQNCENRIISQYGELTYANKFHQMADLTIKKWFRKNSFQPTST